MWDYASAVLPVVGQIGGAYLTSKSNDRATDKNIEIQRELAQNGLSWRVEDARKAGINPLAALGAQTASFTPGYVGDNGSQNDYSFLGEAGQQIGRAIDAKTTAEERARNRVYQEKANDLTLENMQLQNDALKMDMVTRLARDAERAVNTQQQVPAMPVIS